METVESKRETFPKAIKPQCFSIPSLAVPIIIIGRMPDNINTSPAKVQDLMSGKTELSENERVNLSLRRKTDKNNAKVCERMKAKIKLL